MSSKNVMTKALLKAWQPKDPEWLAMRQQQWQRLQYRLNRKGYNKAKYKRLEAYFFDGKLSYDDEFSVDLSLQLAWHPSNDLALWHQHFNGIFSLIPPEECPSALNAALDEAWFQMNSNFFFNTEGYDPATCDINLFMGREPDLFRFFKCPPLPPLLEAFNINRGLKLYQGAYVGFSWNAYELPADIANPSIYTHGVYHQYLPYLGGFLTEETYMQQVKYTGDTLRTRIWLRDPMVYAQRILQGELQVSPEDFKRVELWREQLAMASPSWQALWQEAERDPVTLREWDAQQEAANPEEEPEPKPKEPWPEELVALLSQLAAHGYACPEDTDRDLCSVLRALPGSAEVGFGTFVYDEYTDDDLEEPYEYFAAPLEQLCELAKLRFSYKTRRGFAEFYADDNRVGRVQLIDPAERYTANYYRDIVRLAEQHFPEQVFCFGEDYFMLYILPKPVIAVLQAAGFESKRDYFGQ